MAGMLLAGNIEQARSSPPLTRLGTTAHLFHDREHWFERHHIVRKEEAQ